MGKKPVVHSVLMVGGLVVLLTAHSGCGCCGQKQKYTAPSTFQGSIKGQSQDAAGQANTGATGGTNTGKLPGNGASQWSDPPKGAGAGTTADLAGRPGQVSLDNDGNSPMYNVPGNSGSGITQTSGTSTGPGAGAGPSGPQWNSAGSTQDPSPTSPGANPGVQNNQTRFGGSTGLGTTSSGMDDMPMPPVSSATGMNNNMPPPPPLMSSSLGGTGQHLSTPTDPQANEQLLAPPPPTRMPALQLDPQ